jgi:hypothetical protein
VTRPPRGALCGAGAITARRTLAAFPLAERNRRRLRLPRYRVDIAAGPGCADSGANGRTDQHHHSGRDPRGYLEMVVFVRSPLGIVVSGLVSIAVAAFIYFVIVKPETDKANDTVNQTLKQTQPQINHANKIQECIANAQGDPQKIAKCE